MGTSQRAALYLLGLGGLPPLFAAWSICMRIHAGTSGTLLREVGRSPSGHDQVLLPGKKKWKNKALRSEFP